MILEEWQPMATEAPNAPPTEDTANWLWNGFLMPGDVTLLTSLWKTGKTTLLGGLLQCLGEGTPFLGRSTRPGKAWVVSEESRSQWVERNRLMSVGPHVRVISRPFQGRPEPEDWDRLISRVVADRPDLFVVDPLASFLTGRSETEASTILESLHPFRRLTVAGCAVLLLHHPRRKAAPVGSAARGSGALLGFVDATMELMRYSSMKSDANRRLILAQSRRNETPERLAYEWNKETGAFAVTVDPRHRQFEENWQTVLGILKGRTEAITSKEIGECWPDDGIKPSRSALYNWLELAHDRKMVRREGSGTSANPWRYRLENEDDRYYDRGELPPLKPLRPFRR